MSVIHTKTLLALAVTLATTGFAHAQETTPAPDTGQPAVTAPAATAEPPAAPAQTAQPATGAPATTQPTAEAKPIEAEPFVKATHGDWEEKCLKVPEGQTPPCNISQLLKDDTNYPVATISVLPYPGGEKAAAVATIVTPLETLLTEQLVLKIDNGNPQIFPFAWCDRDGCVVRIGLVEKDLNAFKNGKTASITMVPARQPDQKVTAQISLKGFTAGFSALPVPKKP